MSAKSDIEWTDSTWNPTRGCSRVSQGCVNCYAERVANRFSGPGKQYEGLVNAHGRWNGIVRLVTEHLADPLKWRKPRRVFVNSMSDLFHEGLTKDVIAALFAIMASTPRHTFQILTKRPDRMREVMSIASAEWFFNCSDLHFPQLRLPMPSQVDLPLPNVWLGVSVENQAAADERIPLLLETPAAVRFVSYEPALGPVDFRRIRGASGTALLDALTGATCAPGVSHRSPRIDWIIAGSESGPGARPAELEWFRSVRDQCAAAGVSFFFKQWGGAVSFGTKEALDYPHGVFRKVSLPILDGRQHVEWPR